MPVVMPLAVRLSPAGRIALVTPVGELDVGIAARLRPVLREAAATQAPLLVVDLAGVTFVDSTVLGVLVETHRALAPRRRLLVVNAHGLPLRVLQLTGLDGVLEVVRPEDPLEEELAGVLQAR